MRCPISGRRARIAVTPALARGIAEEFVADPWLPSALDHELGAVLANFQFGGRSSLRLRVELGQRGADEILDLAELGSPGEARLSQGGLDALAGAIRARPRLLAGLVGQLKTEGALELRVALRSGRYVGGSIAPP